MNKSHFDVPTKTHTFFLYDPEGDGFLFFRTQEERDTRVKEVIELYVEEGEWDPSVENIFTGRATDVATMVDRVDRPAAAELEEGVDGSGRYWPDDCEFICRYEMLPVKAKE